MKEEERKWHFHNAFCNIAINLEGHEDELLLLSALARGSESGIYSHKVRMYVRTWWVTLRNVTQNVVTYRIYHRCG